MGHSDSVTHARTHKVRRALTAGLPPVVVFAAALAHVAYYFPRVVDDLFISLRYAENLAGGHGAVYNPGERVEGYSGPLWMLLQALGFVLRFEGVTWTKALGTASLLATQLGLYRLARDVLGVRPLVAWAPALVLAANSYVVNWSVLGLETPLHLATIVLAPVAVDAALKAPGRGRRLLAVAALVALGTSRPESMLYLGVILGAPLLTAGGKREAITMARRLAPVALPALAALAALLLLRRAYYGHFVPNTYFVKGSDTGFDLARLAPLWGQGASASEAALYLGGAALLAFYGVRRRALAPALVALGCLYFTASVILDWMPSLRHLLPVTVLAPLGWTCLLDSLLPKDGAKDAGAARALAAALPVFVLAHAAWHVAGVDNRYSPEEKRNRPWIMPKTREKWSDTVLAYRRIEPPHVTRMGPYEMGQITQAWAVLEASAGPVRESWFVGRDIGAVGYYTGVRVFDTAGLFTPAISHSREWVEHRRVTPELIRTAMALRPLAGEIYEGWELALGEQRDLLAGYRLRFGTWQRPYAFVATDRTPPAREEVLRRYGDLVAKFPRRYHLHTLYGESIGAVVERRLRVVETGAP